MKLICGICAIRAWCLRLWANPLKNPEVPECIKICSLMSDRPGSPQENLLPGVRPTVNMNRFSGKMGHQIGQYDQAFEVLKSEDFSGSKAVEKCAHGVQSEWNEFRKG
ncbi:hypothetical protein OIU77_005048 [Salix suchowensis]|uniref:Uncharacterized protein n=1 Tax=Salix suchowensis TaxID=1278906 RepID=A0ABQ8ZGX9_9ROSI|nr:hypothetical protein OIU77_005048 [Salix suchowensis]